MMKNNEKKKGNNAKKILPAAGMLALSASMLATSTYAWFTMSREVEVSNISMSATVPEDIQISLGQIGTANDTASTSETEASLANGKGVLVATNNVVSAPTNNWDWANIADISEYYQFGKLIPASSTDGTNIYFTPDADGAGKTIKSDAAFYPAALSGTAQSESGVGGSTSTGKFNATAHVVTSKSDGYVTDTWKDGGADKYQTSENWNATKDDGYYVDIPVWLRTSSVNGASVSVMAYVKPRDTSTTNNSAGEALYRALRVSILEETTANNTTSWTNKTNLIPIADGCEKTAVSATVGALRSDPFKLSVTANESTTNYNILDWYTRKKGEQAVASITNGTTTGVYGEASTYTPNAQVVALAAPTHSTNNVKSTSYGEATKIIVRVWLEGEDPDCWNETAGQDWSINLKFNNETTNAGAASNTDVSGVNQGEAPVPQPNNP